MAKSIKDFVNDQYDKNKSQQQLTEVDRVNKIGLLTELTRIAIQTTVNHILLKDSVILPDDVVDKITLYTDKGTDSDDNRLRIVINSGFIHDILRAQMVGLTGRESYLILLTVFDDVMYELNKNSLHYQYDVYTQDYDKSWGGFRQVAQCCPFVFTVKDATARNKFGTHGVLEVLKHCYWHYGFGNNTSLFKRK